MNNVPEALLIAAQINHGDVVGMSEDSQSSSSSSPEKLEWRREGGHIIVYYDHSFSYDYSYI